MNSQIHTLRIGVFLASAALCFGQSAWLPATHELKTTPGFSYSSFDEFWVGRTKVKNPPNGKSLDQYTGYVSLEYGIFENLAADATMGYTATSTDAFGGNASDEGLSDTMLGLRYRLIDENNAPCRWAPTLAIRAGAVIAGSYDSNKPFSAGDGAGQLELRHGIEPGNGHRGKLRTPRLGTAH